jgi:nucleoside phosphorylase
MGMGRRKHPIMEHPGGGGAVIEPARLYAGKRRLPRRCVLCFFVDVLRGEVEEGALRQVDELRGEGDPIPVYIHDIEGGEPVTVAFPGVGAPHAAASLEELIGMGCEVFVCCGGAGVLDSSIAPGELILPTAALRHEGTSYHYQRSGRWSTPHPAALRALEEACQAQGVPYRLGRTWTTDGVYRETPAMVRQRRAEGCMSVEMEAAAFFAVARFRRVCLGQILYAGDDVSGPEWRHRRWIRLAQVREKLYRLSLDASRRC